MRTKVLLVDDDPFFSEIAAHALEKHNYEVTTAGDGPEALTHFAEQDFDVVVCDRVLPQMSGDEIGAEMHALHPNVPLLLISGGSEKGYDRDVFRAFCRKPFVLRTLTDAIESALKSRVEHAA